MKFIFIILTLLSQNLFAVTVKEAGGSADDSSQIKSRSFPQPSAEEQAKHLKSLSNKGIGAPTTRRYSATGVDFDGRTSNFIGSGTGHGDKSCMEASTEQFIDHEIKMKNGEILRWIDIWGDDSNVAEDMTAILYRQCFPLVGAGGTVTDFILIEDIPRSSGEFLYSKFLNLSFEDNEEECKLMARVRFGDYLNGSCAGASDLRLFKYRAEFRNNDLIFIDNFQDY